MTEEESAAHEGSAATVDGQLDCSRYTDMQLRELLALLNEGQFPINVSLIKAAIKERAARDGTGDVAQTRITDSKIAEDAGRSTRVKYTALSGWRGWWAAKRERLPFFWQGTLEASTDPVALTGSCRTWLGVQTVGERRISRDRIRNVAVVGPQLSFQWRRFMFYRRLTLTCGSEREARQLAISLPAVKTDQFEEQWTAHRELIQGLERKGVRPIVTYVTSALCLIAYVGMSVGSGGRMGLSWPTLVGYGANYGPVTTSGQWWRLITALFLHGGLLHLLVNLWVMWHSGRLTERLFGSGRYALIWLGTGLVASMSSVTWNPSLASVGASGAIFGVLGAFLGHAMRPGARLSMRVLKTHWISTAIFVLFSLANGLMGVGIDNAAHVGGFLSGLAMGMLLAEPLPTVDRSDEKRPGLFGRLAPVAAAVFVGCWVTLGYLYVRGYGASLPPAAMFLKNHQWFLTGEADNLRKWGGIGSDADSGLSSPADIARRFRAELLPFWKDAVSRLEQELPRLPQNQQPLAKDILAYSRERLALINDVNAGVERDGAVPLADIKVHVAKMADQIARVTRLRMDAEAAASPRALSSSRPVIKLRGWFAKNHTCVLPPSWMGHGVGPHDDPADGPSQRNTIRCRVQEAFLARDFATIEHYLRAFAREDVDPVEGWTRHSSPFDGLDDLSRYGPVNIGNMLATLSAWRSQYPRSDAPILVEAGVFVNWAWAARSGAYAKEVTPQQWQAFRTRLVMAQAALDEAQRAAETEPEWYRTRLTIALGMDEKLEARTQLASKALSAFPLYRPLYGSILHTMMPRWGGSYEQIESQISAMASAWGERADEIYAQTYTSYARSEGDASDFFDDGKFDWVRFSAGYQALMDRFPLSNAILNEYAFMACRANRPGIYGGVRSQLTARRAESVWTDKFTLKHCDELMQWKEQGRKAVLEP